MKRISLTFDPQWVLELHNSHRTLPKQVILDNSDSFRGLDIRLSSSGFTDVSLDLLSRPQTTGIILRRTRKLLMECWEIDSEKLDQVMSVTISDIPDPEEPKPDDSHTKQNASASSVLSESGRGEEDGADGNGPDRPSYSDSVEAILEKARTLKGASRFAALCEHISRLAPLLHKHQITRALIHQTYLFSVDNGYGNTTACSLLAKLYQLTGLLKLKNTQPVELTIPAISKPEDLQGLPGQISYAKGRLLCLDITNIISEVSTEEFRRILASVQDINEESVIVFRVPYLEQSAIDSLCQSISDILNVRPVSFVPLSADQLKDLAMQQLSAIGFTVHADAWELFRRRIEFEKSDGRFYGVHTVDKIVDEMLLCKMDQVLLSGNDNNVITAKDIDDLVAGILNQNEDPEKSLQELVGIDAIRSSLEQIMNQIEFSRRNANIAAPSMHMRFLGNPGTGKTTVARYIGAIFRKKGLLSNGYFIEHSGGDFLGKYVGHTVPRVISICRDAYGSVLFIDEAYTLADADYSGANTGFAREAINTLLAQMENHRENMVVIMAGYPEDMERLNAINPGLASRIPYTLHFPNYTREQLSAIFMQMVHKSRFVPSDDLEEAVQAYFNQLDESVITAKNFSNARFVRNLFERSWSKTLTRVQLSGLDLYQITAEDFSAAADEDASILNKAPEKKRTIGFGKHDTQPN